MNENIVKAIEFLAGKIKDEVTADEALKYTQAANNLANTNICLINARLADAAK